MADHKSPNPTTRREALRRVGSGFGMMAFASMLGQSLVRAGGVIAPDGTLGAAKLDHPQRIKRVIFLFMNRRWSHRDRFDPKPMLDKYDSKPPAGGPGSPPRRT